MKVILTTALFCAMMSFASAQCTDAQMQAFVGSEPNVLACVPQLLTLGTSNNSATLDTALKTVCTSYCGGPISEFYNTTCNDQFNATSLTLGCLKRNDANRPFTRCFNAFFNAESVFSAAGPACFGQAIPDQATCVSTGCQANLTNIVTQLGCCFQSTYNSSTYLQLLVTQGFINNTDASAIQAFGDLALWTTCGVTPPSTCVNVGNQFPSTMCNLQDQTSFALANPAVLACSNQLLTLNTSTNPTELDDVLETVCTAECGGALSEWLRSNCQDIFGSTSLALSCLKRSDDNRTYTRCHSAFFVAAPILNATGYSCQGITNEATCNSTGCKANLMNIVSQLGCCYQNIFNDTNFLKLLLGQGRITELEFGGTVAFGNANLWTTCGVTPPSTCVNTGNSFPITTTEAATTAHGTQLVPQFIVIALAMVVVFRLEVLFQ